MNTPRGTVVILCLVLLAATASAFGVTLPEGEVVPIVTSGPVWSPYLVPFAVSGDFPPFYGEQYTWHVESEWSEGLAPGSFGVIDLGEGLLWKQIAGTVMNSLGIGANVEQPPGNKGYDFRRGMVERLHRSNYGDGEYMNWTWQEYPLDSRLIVLPFMQREIIDGRIGYTVTGFAGFYIDDHTYGTQGDTITGYFTYLPEEALPEPSSLLALLSGGLGLASLKRRQKH